MLIDRKTIKEKLLDITPNEVSDPEKINKKLKYIEDSSYPKIDIIWSAVDIAKERPELALEVAKYFEDNEDPTGEFEINKDLKNGDDVRVITSIRGTLPYLLQNIASTLRTDLYGEIIRITKKLNEDSVEYVRQQSCVALDILAANRYATKNEDGSDFVLNENYRRDIEEMVFKMLNNKENQKYDRIIQYLTMPINRLRRVSGSRAMNSLKTLYFKEHNVFRIHEVIRNTIPLHIFYAEIRDENENFKRKPFQDYLKYILKKSNLDTKTAAVWHFAQAIKHDEGLLKNIYKYIDDILDSDFESSLLSQIDLLIEKVIKFNKYKGIEIFKKALDWIKVEELKPIHGRDIFFFNADKYIEIMKIVKDVEIKDAIIKLQKIDKLGGWVGEMDKINNIYTQIEQKKYL